jgi:hypothetical protein
MTDQNQLLRELLQEFVDLYGNSDVRKWMALRDRMRAALSNPAQPAPDAFREALQEECDLLLIPMPADPREAVKAVVAANVRIALDPAVSREAQALIDQGKAAQPQGAGDAVRTDEVIVQQTEELAAWLMHWRWEQEPDGAVQFRNTQNTKAQRCWDAACHIQELLTATDVENAVACVDDAPAASQQAAQAVPEGFEPASYKCGHLTIQAASQIDGSSLWKITDALGNTLNRNGGWEWEPSPSNRDDAYLARCRYKTLDECAAMLRAAKGEQ